MRKTLLFLILGLASWAQGQVVTGTITGTACLTIDVQQSGVVGIVISNSPTGSAWSGTIQPQVFVADSAAVNSQVTPYSSNTAQATITANGAFSAAVSGATTFQVCGNTVTNTASVRMNAVKLAARIGNGGFSSSLFESPAGTLNLGTAGSAAGGIIYAGSTSGTLTTVGCFPQGACTGFGSSTVNTTFAKYSTGSNCNLGGATGTTSPAACGSASNGRVAIPASQTTFTINTTATSANSNIVIRQIADNSSMPSSPTCGTTTVEPILESARTAATSFTFTLTSVAQVTCITYDIRN